MTNLATAEKVAGYERVLLAAAAYRAAVTSGSRNIDGIGRRLDDAITALMRLEER